MKILLNQMEIWIIVYNVMKTHLVPYLNMNQAELDVIQESTQKSIDPMIRYMISVNVIIDA